MYAVEFEAKNKGRFIELPFDIPENETIAMRVVVMSMSPLDAIAKQKKMDHLEVLKKRELHLEPQIDVDRLIDEMNA